MAEDNKSEFDDQLPDPVVHNVEKMEAADASMDLLDKLIDHIDNNQYIPWEKVKLPSKGIYYGDKIPDGYIEIKPMGVDVDKMLSNSRLAQSGELLNKILEACVKLPPDFSVREMLAGDFNFLMYYLRGITHGNNYEFSSVCPHCGTKNLFNFDLSALSQTITWANPEYPEEPFEVELPQLSKTFETNVFALVRMIRMDDVMKMSRSDDSIYDPVKTGRVKLHKKNKQTQISNNNNQDISKMYENNMKSQVVGFVIEGQKFIDRGRVDKIISKFHQKDSAHIRDFLEKVSPSIDTTLDAVCANPDCGEESTVSLPFNENFFRPTA